MVRDSYGSGNMVEDGYWEVFLEWCLFFVMFIWLGGVIKDRGRRVRDLVLDY